MNEKKILTLEEYESKYNSKNSVRSNLKPIINLFISLIGILILTCLFFVCVKLFEINDIIGYIGIGISFVLFILLFIIPMIKIKKSDYFITTTKNTSLNNIKRLNKNLRYKLAKHIIDLYNNTDKYNWYSKDLIDNLSLSIGTKNDRLLKDNLNLIYKTNIKKTCISIINEHSLNVGISTALSQSKEIDSLCMAIFEIDLIKQIIYLYGYRPNEEELLKICKHVLTNSLLAYGVNSATNLMSKSIVNSFANMVPILKDIVGTLIDSASQGIVNAILTIIIGYETKKYLDLEYKKSSIIDNIDELNVNDEEELKKMKLDIGKNITESLKNIKQ